MTATPSPSQPKTGACRCGRVWLEITKAPLITMACHCSGCQRMTASAFSLSAAIPADGFRVTRGAPVPGGLHGAVRHFFCPDCMSWMFTRPPGADAFVNVRTALLDGDDWKEPFVETWTSEKLPWASTPARHSFPGFPAEIAWPGLVAEFQTMMAGG